MAEHIGESATIKKGLTVLADSLLYCLSIFLVAVALMMTATAGTAGMLSASVLGMPLFRRTSCRRDCWPSACHPLARPDTQFMVWA